MALFGEMIRLMREERKLSQDDLAKAAGVRVAQLQRWEQAEAPTMDMAAYTAIATALGMRPTELADAWEKHQREEGQDWMKMLEFARTVNIEGYRVEHNLKTKNEAARHLLQDLSGVVIDKDQTLEPFRL